MAKAARHLGRDFASANPTALWFWHKVKPGDTLAALAAAYGTTVQAIAALNAGLITNVNVIDVGWNIRIK